MYLVLLGAPGSGKGTQSALIQERYGIPQISTGDILREAIAKGTALGEKAKSFVNSGGLVPDDLIIDLVRERIAEPDAAAGFILDGFPRSIPQADGLETLLRERGLSLTRVVKIDVPKRLILQRMTSRRICPNCGAVYNVLSKPPARDEVCDQCGAGLIQREDDAEGTVRRRLNVYEVATKPLIDYYDGRGLLRIVDGSGDADEVFGKISRELGPPGSSSGGSVPA
jgi:adenylate kinase